MNSLPAATTPQPADDTEVPLSAAKIGGHRNVNHFEYDSLIHVIVMLPSRGLQGYEDALLSLSLLVSP